MTEFNLLTNHVYKVSIENRAQPFCKCQFPRNMDLNIIENINDTCKCGENLTNALEWSWDEKLSHLETYINGKNVIFHPTYSQGTAIIRGDKPLNKHMHHYWEVKIITSLSGTDIVSLTINYMNYKKYNFFLYIPDVRYWYR